MKGWKKIFQANGKEKHVRIGILISDDIDIDVRNIKKKKKDTL